MKKVAINGFGRIGRLVFRELINDKDIKITAINDLADPKTLAHLLKYDTAQGKFKGSVSVVGDKLVVDGHEIKVLAERDPKKLPWKSYQIDTVVESTGLFLSRSLAEQHITAGAKKVVISAPSKSDDVKTIVFGVNHGILTADDVVVSAASCTTNALAPVAASLNEAFGIEKGLITTVHGYTADQPLQDRPHRDLRRARAGAVNIVPTTTGAAKAVGKVLPELNGKLHGVAVRVPVITGSLVDLVVEFKDKKVTVEKINEVMKNSISSAVGYTEDPIVSSDIIGETHGTIFDAEMTTQITVDGKTLFKIFTWYDNESSFVHQFVRTFKHLVML